MADKGGRRSGEKTDPVSALFNALKKLPKAALEKIEEEVGKTINRSQPFEAP